MKKDIKPIPEFKTEDEERAFWATHSLVDYFDAANAYRPTEPFHNLKPSEDLLEFKMPLDDVKSLDSLAQKQHVTRDVLARNVLHEWIQRQRAHTRA
jgi:hypothetical protein